MRTLDVISALIMLVLSVAAFAATRHLPYWADFAPGSAFGPFWVSAAGVVFSLSLLVGALRRKANPPVDWPDRSGFMRVGLAAGALCVMVALAPLLGLVATSILFTLFLLVVVERRPIAPSLLTTGVTAALVYGVFVAWLGIAFPKGLLGV
jgi:putative tricarboxylic transport membrane protein